MRRFLLGLLGILLLLPGLAHAEGVQSWNIYDGRRDALHGIDIEQTFLSVRRPGFYVVRIRGYEFTRERLNFAGAYFDTSRNNTGPEYRVSWRLPKDGDGRSGRWVTKVDTWTDAGRTVRCPRLQTSVDYARDVVTIAVPRKCLGRPAEVRWNARTGRVRQYRPNGVMYGRADFVPDRRRFAAAFWVG